VIVRDTQRIFSTIESITTATARTPTPNIRRVPRDFPFGSDPAREREDDRRRREPETTLFENSIAGFDGDAFGGDGRGEPFSLF
jgi:hypothetical protein